MHHRLMLGALVALAFAVVLVGCAATDPQLAARAAQIPLRKQDPPVACVELGVVTTGVNFDDYVAARARIREDAARRGGNYIRLEASDVGTVFGTAFRCPETPDGGR